MDLVKAKENFDMYLKEGLVKKESFNALVYSTYMNNASESLRVAKMILDEQTSSLWVIVTSYYAMFYVANACLYKLGYKVGHKIAHKVTSDCLKVLVKDKLAKHLLEEYDLASEDALEISSNLIQNYDHELTKRSQFQYETTSEIKLSKAKTSFERAQEFSFEIQKLMLNQS